MLTGITLVENWTHYSQYDHAPSEAEKTAWTLGAVDVLVRSTIQDNATAWVSNDGGGGMQMINRTTARNMELVRFGLKNVERFQDAKGNDIPITFVDRAFAGGLYKVVSDDFMKCIPGAVIEELANEILKKNTGSDALRKK